MPATTITRLAIAALLALGSGAAGADSLISVQPDEANSQDLKIRETETRIEQESAALRERLEAVKFSTLQWLMGVCTGTAAIILGVWRLLM